MKLLLINVRLSVAQERSISPKTQIVIFILFPTQTLLQLAKMHWVMAQRYYLVKIQLITINVDVYSRNCGQFFKKR